jgi:hypothetical protein
VVDLLEQSSAWLDGQRKQFLSRSVTYNRGSVSVVVLAAVGKTNFEIDTTSGVTETFESRDYIILAADLAINGTLLTPQRGDTITDVQGGQTLVYEVTGPGREPCWRWSNPYRTSMRIHTKQVGGP